jgi:hypothetical protein
MASTPREKLKQAALLTFVIAGVVLAALNWAGNLDDRPPGQPSFYRPTFSLPTRTPTPKVVFTPTATPGTPTPGPSPTLLPTIED